MQETLSVDYVWMTGFDQAIYDNVFTDDLSSPIARLCQTAKVVDSLSQILRNNNDIIKYCEGYEQAALQILEGKVLGEAHV
ncbi:MAG: hypothetical protein ACXWLH_05750 [Candidatus Saccharimonadales bacterium]